MAWNYSDKTKQIFMDAVQGKPGTHLGEVPDPDGFGEHGSIVCGDALRFTFRVEKHPTDPLKDRIVEARYLTFGCTSAIAASEALCDLIEKGRYTPLEALKITNQDIVDYLEGLPSQKIHCSVMGAEALESAVFNWAQKRGVDLEKLGVQMQQHTEEGRIVCKCFSVSEPYIRRKIKELNLRTIPEITNAIKAGGACMTCHHAPGGLQDILDDIWGKQKDGTPESQTDLGSESAGSPDLAPQAFEVPSSFEVPAEQPERPALSPFQFMKKVEATIDKYVRPMLAAEGGDIELIDIKDALVYARLTGACAGCAGASTTMKMMVERTLKELVDEKIRVIAV